jgi:hypothetical protein
MNPQEHLTSATYLFTSEQLHPIVEAYIKKKTGISGIPFSFDSDEDDYVALLMIDEDDIEEEYFDILQERMPEWDESHHMLQYVLEEYMKADVYRIQAVQTFERINGEHLYNFKFYVEVNSRNYVTHSNLSEWFI